MILVISIFFKFGMKLGDMASYSGHNDDFMHVRFGDAIPPRPFPSPAAARAYFLSGLDKAREMVEGVRENSEGSRKAAQLATRLVSALGGLRGLAEGPGYDHETLVERAIHRPECYFLDQSNPIPNIWTGPLLKLLFVKPTSNN